MVTPATVLGNSLWVADSAQEVRSEDGDLVSESRAPVEEETSENKSGFCTPDSVVRAGNAETAAKSVSFCDQEEVAEAGLSPQEVAESKASPLTQKAQSPLFTQKEVSVSENEAHNDAEDSHRDSATADAALLGQSPEGV
uniref:Uncharacterized protein n=1 Tax=uncultured organism MedDCM-OCT-S09-C171 TaxID=743644 RepID=D6PJC6_9ZZZZ|nr:hypothetical protein [uncultured organism MedDCM-OCT-S09-C171]